MTHIKQVSRQRLTFPQTFGLSQDEHIILLDQDECSVVLSDYIPDSISLTVSNLPGALNRARCECKEKPLPSDSKCTMCNNRLCSVSFLISNSKLNFTRTRSIRRREKFLFNSKPLLLIFVRSSNLNKSF